MKRDMQVWVDEYGTEPRQLPLAAALDKGEFFVTESECWQHISERHFAEATRKEREAEEAHRRGTKAAEKALAAAGPGGGK